MMTVGILDDEPISADYLRSVLQKIVDIEVVGCFSNEFQALERFEAEPPELIFIDINMPHINGFRFLEELQSRVRRLPLVVFVSAHTEFALDAYQTKAVDYVLKPFTHKRVYEALQRARSIIAHPSLQTVPLIAKEGEDVARKLEELTSGDGRQKPTKSPKRPKMIVKDSGSRIVVDLEKIIWVEAEGDYVRLSDTRRVYFTRGTLKSMQQKLEGLGFVRIHRSRIVRLENITKYSFSSSGENLVEMSDGTLFAVSRGYKADLRKKIEAD